MNVWYIGNTRAPWCSEVHIGRDLEALGHSVQHWQEPSRPGDGLGFVQGFEKRALEERPDLVLFTRTWGLPPTTTGTWRRLEAEGIATMSLHLDLYYGLERERTLANDPFWTTQWVVTPDGNPDSAERFAAAGINHIWSPPGVVSDECKIGNYRPEFAVPVVFVGSYGYHDEWGFRPKLIDWLADRYGSKFRRFGGDLPGGPVRGQDLNDLYRSCGVAIGDSCFARRDTLYTSDRPYETLGRGGFLLNPRIDFLTDELAPVESVAFYEPENLEDLGDKIDASLAFFDRHSDSRAWRCEQGSAWVKENASYKVRLANVLERVGLS